MFKENAFVGFPLKIRRIAFLLSVVIVLTILFSAAYLLVNASHSHRHIDDCVATNNPCGVCLKIQEICDMFKKMGTGTTAFIYLVTFSFIAGISVLTHGVHLTDVFSLISIKVRFNN